MRVVKSTPPPRPVTQSLDHTQNIREVELSFDYRKQNALQQLDCVTGHALTFEQHMLYSSHENNSESSVSY